jgi:S1-C subfamily serine protease
MTDQESPAFSWTCPQCGRHVPHKVPACRCGQARPETAEPTPEETVAQAQAPPVHRNVWSVLTTAGVALAAALGAFVWMNSRTTAPATIAPAAGTRGAPSAPVLVLVKPAPDQPPPEPPPNAAADAKAPPESPPDPPASLEDLISHAMPAVVRVETGSGFGSGFFVTPDTILTNVHVVDSSGSVTIRRPDGTTVPGHVETAAPELDIAIVRISNADPHQATLPMGSGIRARAGQEVVALGAPLGLQNTVTRGIVSAVRLVGAVTLVQTDAAINPGNSGGPLIDRAGDVVGITTMSMRSAVAQGLSFAIAIDHARALLAGKRPSQGAGTPIASLNEAMSGAAPPQGDALREQGTKAYEQGIVALGRRADALDDSWNSFKRVCYEGRIVGTFGREWFALWDSRAMPGLVPPGCLQAFADIRRVAEDIRNTVASLEETARRADVYPGVRRDLLRRYRLDYPGWDR